MVSRLPIWIALAAASASLLWPQDPQAQPQPPEAISEGKGEVQADSSAQVSEGSGPVQRFRRSGRLLPVPPRPTPFRITGGSRSWVREARQRFQASRTALQTSAERTRNSAAAVRSRARADLVKSSVKAEAIDSVPQPPPTGETASNSTVTNQTAASVSDAPATTVRPLEPKVEPKPSPFP